MRQGRFLPFVALVLMTCISSATAQDTHQHDHQHDHGESFGKVSFTISCGGATQSQFNRAAAMLHSFLYARAEEAFSEVAKANPDCAMAYWGIAASNYHPIWEPPTPAELKRGLAAVEKAKSIGGKTERERDYIAAMEIFYKDSDKLDHRTRAIAYEKAMEQLHLRYPDDNEAAIFYALSLLGTALPTDKTYANQKKAAEILNRLLPKEPEHPGIAHYVIHSFDYPQLAQLALPAARVYAKIAPSAPHALHMPTHIFTRLGLWEDSINSNLASANTAKKYVQKTMPGAASFDQLHAMDYLMYAYLQGGQDEKAKRVLEETLPMSKLDAETFAAAYAFAAIPARYTLERRQWADAAQVSLHPATFSWSRFPYAEAIIHFARALGSARTGNPTAAKQAVEKLASIRDALAQAKQSYWADQVEIQRRAAASWLAKAEGKNDEALELMRKAAELESSTEKHPVTPGAVLPAREMLGDLLMELNRPAEALKEYEESLAVSPNRFNGLHGAARAAALSGDKKKAKKFYQALVALGKNAAGDRAALREAKTFVSEK